MVPHYSIHISQIDLIDVPDIPTIILPAIALENSLDRSQSLKQATAVEESDAVGSESQIAVLRKLVTSSGIYALSSVVSPLIGLVLAPFLTHHLSLSDYGTLAIINTAISLAVGITQLGLSSAFFRAYGYDYKTSEDRRDVVATVTTLLCLISLPFALLLALLAPYLAKLLFGNPDYALDLTLAGGVVLLQNLTLPGMFIRRVDSRPLSYSLLSLSNLLVTLLATLLLVGMLHIGIAGAIIGNGLGYACIVGWTLPGILWSSGIKIRLDIAKNLLGFGLPLVINFISYWFLQLSDRYLLSHFTSLAETAKYAVAYTLGSVVSVTVITPFTLAWGALLFPVAKRKDAPLTFQLIFRWFSTVLLFSAFALSFAATIVLDWFFPPSYHSTSRVIPFIAEALVFYGFYFVFMVGANIQRKMWLTAVFMSIAAVINVILNLILLPYYGALGAAAATLIAYAVLAMVAYPVNQRLYPVPFEIGRFIGAFFIGVSLYIGCGLLSQNQRTYIGWGIYLGGLLLYGVLLVWLGRLLPSIRRLIQKQERRKSGNEDTSS
ncbi:MAG TPA: lipopolysaccharide biosynthesis protein [Ktedonobacteraceae bacterium]|nr:lipopolysaccharide biosynthesis protein [Ktedonobacteraceae bacterium]